MDIYDNGGKTIDRYTIFLTKGSDECIGASTTGSAFYMHVEAKRGRHLGKKIQFTDLDTELRIRLAHE